jgi:uncharacterized membrane protein
MKYRDVLATFYCVLFFCGVWAVLSLPTPVMVWLLGAFLAALAIFTVWAFARIAAALWTGDWS